MKEELYEKFVKLREKLQKEFKGQQICDDDALLEIALYLPDKPEHFHAIRGCGDAFVEKYAKYFIEIIKQYKSGTEQIKLDEKQKNFINRLENRLINISKRNPNLYLSNTNSSNYYDIYDNEEFNIVEALFFDKNKRVIELFNMSYPGANKKVFRTLSRLNRALEKDMMDRGEYNLYIAYPFVHGITPDKSFEINAPLSYFPVQMTKNSGRFTIKPDPNREIVLNESFLIMAMKFIINKELDIENTELDFSNLQFENLIDELIKQYKYYNIEMKKPADSKIIKLDVENFNLKVGLKIKNFIGRFSSFTNSIQRDINKIKRQEHLNTNLHKILFDSESKDISLDGNFSWDVDQINQLDYSQLKVLNHVNKEKSLVIEGPPGTGKSQVIVSIITNTTSKDKNVLMVAEKKAAIDVIYSRLKKIRNYTIIIDDPNNKKVFYDQIKQLLKQKIKQEYNESKEDKVRAKLEKEIIEYEAIIADINDKTRYEISLTKLMELHDKIALSSEESKHYNVLLKMFKSYFEDKSYENVIEILDNLFRENKADFETLFKIKSESKYITSLKKELDYSDFMALKNILEAYKQCKEKSGLFKRMFNRIASGFKLIRYTKNKGKLLKRCLTTPFLDTDINTYETYQSIKYEFEQIDKPFQKFYISIDAYKKEKNIELTYDQLVSYYANFIIRNLQKSKKSSIRKYAKTRRIIDKLYIYYKSLIQHNITKLDNLLNKRSEEVKKMKRYSIILKAISSKRLPNIASFIEKYEFELFRLVRIWLMTPNGVSTLLPLRPDMFDLNIFDEASQMYFERSLPSIYRAKRSIIAGDEKQLRPSSFGFGRLEGVNDEDYVLEEYSILDEESLLDFVKPKLPCIRLEYHYRSHFQELINVSNYLFYNRDLVVPPYKNYSNEDSPLKYISVENGLWVNNSNKPEAIRVVDTLVEVLKEYKNTKSIGIITFNIHQRELIEDLIDDRLEEDQEFHELYLESKQKVEDNEHVGLFVKNVENVQGDQRDIILISVAYSYNEDGIFQHQFGWLSQKYGENRLNVCVTRSKFKTYVFVSFDLQDFNAKELKNDGPRVLKNYLQYAKFISENDYKKSVEFINSLIQKETDEEESNVISFGNENLEYKVYDVKGVKGSPVDYMLKGNGSEDGIGLLMHKANHSFQKDYYFLEKYLEWIEAKHERVNMFHFWEDKDAYIKNILSKYQRNDKQMIQENN